MTFFICYEEQFINAMKTEYTEKTIKQEFSIQASGNIIDSIFVNDDFKMKMPYSNITGSGQLT